MMPERQPAITASHWGVGIAHVENGRVVAVDGHPGDPNPSPINENIASSLSGKARILRPAIRRGWLEKDGTRGRDAFVEVSWDEAYDCIANELKRIPPEHRYAGSYGWSSAGRVHHAQSLLKRFLNTQGGFIRSEGNYSYNAALVLMPYIVGPYRKHVAEATRWSVIARSTDLMVMFGGMAMRNTQVSDGGIGQHRMAGNLEQCVASGVRFVSFSPFRGDADPSLGAEWLPPKPGSDTAVMMGLAHTLLVEDLHDRAFLERYTVGFDNVADYLLGGHDGTPKSADWASEQSGIPAEWLRDLAREMASSRTMISCAAGLQRADYGEQPLWMTVTLASMLGQIGLPGGGYVIGYGVNGNIGNIERPFRWGTMSQGRNPVSDFIPVAMISEMLLNPGERYAYNGQSRVFPDARMIWWAGGNPFHHHQNLNRLHEAFQRPETVIVNDINWTATARHADIVLPVAAPQERMDFCGGKSDNFLVPMPRLVPPPEHVRLEYDIYADLAARLGNAEAFTEGLDADGWVRRIWQRTQDSGAGAGFTLPDWDEFIEGDMIALPDPAPDQVFLADYRADPVAHALPTPSGRIELFSEKIDSFQLADCPGCAHWFPQRDDAANLAPLFMLSGQPGTRLHSQLDNGATSLASKVQGREPVLIHPADADKRGIIDGDVIELSNARGRTLAGARVTDAIAQGCVFLWTGAWWDPDFNAPQARDRHGNPNALTHDLRTSSLAQATAAHSAKVELRRYDGEVPAITVHDPPVFLPAERSDIRNTLAGKNR